MSVRTRRLQADYEQIKQALRAHPSIRIRGVSGTPPDRYQIEYKVRSLCETAEGRVVARNEHVAEIYLVLGYPRRAPQCRMLSPVFHPNIAPHAICIGDHWAAGEALLNLILRIGEMLAFQSYNTQSPLNGAAARWVDEHLEQLPIDTTDLSPTAWAEQRADEGPRTGECANCRSSDKELATCVNGHQVCPDCLVTCTRCERTFCLLCKLETCAECGRLLCADCRARCPQCRRVVCRTHLESCAICGKEGCPDCSITCRECGRQVCLEHVGQCSVCGAELCTEHASVCVGCRRTVCSEHAQACEVCGGVACPDCSFECAECGKRVCLRHVGQCSECQKILCPQHGRMCPTCGRTFCGEHFDAEKGRCSACAAGRSRPAPGSPGRPPGFPKPASGGGPVAREAAGTSAPRTPAASQPGQTNPHTQPFERSAAAGTDSGTIISRCTGCGVRLRVPASAVGREVQCPKCGAMSPIREISG
jgi:ubiquitin-protein ligase